MQEFENTRTRGKTLVLHNRAGEPKRGLEINEGKARTDPLYTPPMEILVFTHGCNYKIGTNSVLQRISGSGEP